MRVNRSLKAQLSEGFFVTSAMPPVLTSSPPLSGSPEASVVSASLPASGRGGLAPGPDLLRVVIDERTRPENLNTAPLMAMAPDWRAGQTARTRIFKDYILSTEPFRVKSGLH